MPPREIPTVYVEMDQRIGYSVRSGPKDVIPFVAVCRLEDKYLKKYHRWQLPLEPAFACTTHKMQGATAKYGTFIEPSSNQPFERGLDYVASSRPTEVCKLFLLAPLTNKQFTSFPQERHDIREEYYKLQEQKVTRMPM